MNFHLLERAAFCIGKDEWSSDPPECKVVKCPYPVVPNGEIVSGFGSKFYYKAEVVFKCNAGFTLHGRDTIVCGANSTWEPEMPQCIKDSKPTDPPATPGPSHPDGGIIAAIVVGVLAAIAVIAGGVYFFHHKYNKKRSK